MGEKLEGEWKFKDCWAETKTTLVKSDETEIKNLWPRFKELVALVFVLVLVQVLVLMLVFILSSKCSSMSMFS